MNFKSALKIFILVILIVGGALLVNYVHFGSINLNSYEPPDIVTEEIIPPRQDIFLDNPYRFVDWETFGHYKANLHTHTTKSDGWFSPAKVIDKYHEKGYSILALADHNNFTWPWEDYGRDPQNLGMLAVPANEISDTHHIGSYFSDFNIDGRKYRPYFFATGEKTQLDEHKVMKAIREKNGLAVIFHPGRYDYPPEWYADFYTRYDNVVGMEVINQGDRYPEDRDMWDRVLTLVMPDFPVWGFSNDDMHVKRHLGDCYNVFLMSELSENEFRQAMENGQFYFCLGTNTPVINYIDVDDANGTISISATDWEEIIWISEGRAIYSGETLNFRETPNVGSYVRAKIYGKHGNTYTNPFGVR